MFYTSNNIWLVKHYVKEKIKKLFLLVRYQRQNAANDAITSLLSICYVNTILFSPVFTIYDKKGLNFQAKGEFGASVSVAETDLSFLRRQESVFFVSKGVFRANGPLPPQGLQLLQ